jgi:hypothetical protein
VSKLFRRALSIFTVAALSLSFLVPPASAQTLTAFSPLRWAPPQLNNPIVLQASVGYFAPALQGGHDYMIVCPPGVRQGDMVLAGNPANPARNIVMVGCRSNGRLIVQYFSGIAHIEGTYWAPLPGKDGIDCGGPAGVSGICRIQMTRITGLIGSSNTVHADCFQPWGPIKGFQADRMTCDSNYQGQFLAPPEWIGFVDESRINLRHNHLPNPDGRPGFLYWIGNSDQLHAPGTLPAPVKFSCDLCYAKVRPDMLFMVNAAYPNIGTTIRGTSATPQTLDGGVSLCWKTPPTMITGTPHAACRVIINGDPPQGDFAPASLQMGYTPRP